MLDHDWISLVPLTPNEAETTLLTKVINEIYDSRNQQERWKMGFPNHLFGKILSNQLDKRIYKISPDEHRELTATFNEDLQFTEIFVDGKHDPLWSKALQAANSKVGL